MTRKKTTSKGPIDLFFRNPESAIKKREIKTRKHKAVMSCDREDTARVHIYIA